MTSFSPSAPGWRGGGMKAVASTKKKKKSLLKNQIFFRLSPPEELQRRGDYASQPGRPLKNMGVVVPKPWKASVGGPRAVRPLRPRKSPKDPARSPSAGPVERCPCRAWAPAGPALHPSPGTAPEASGPPLAALAPGPPGASAAGLPQQPCRFSTFLAGPPLLPLRAAPAGIPPPPACASFRHTRGSQSPLEAALAWPAGLGGEAGKRRG